MTLSRRDFVAFSLATGTTLATSAPHAWASPATQPPAPYGATPSRQQLQWHSMETYAFLHFTVNTFTDKEWGYGDEDPNVFNPTDFDPDSIMQVLKIGGMKGVILTCKHHDGFCLWPTATTEHCIRNSRWRNGKGDVVRDISDAARRAGLKFGVYVSPWDRSAPSYATPDYIPIYHHQLRELLANYGPMFEVWFDGANGGDGYYGGAREKRSIAPGYYQWNKTTSIVRTLQPDAVIFGAAGDVRWVGNEKGTAGDPCWATTMPELTTAQNDANTGDAGTQALQHGVRGGTLWKPAECDVSIRPGWFWHEAENAKVKTPDELVDLYFDSVGRGASFLLNLPPNRKGRIELTDAAALAGFHNKIQQIFATELVAKAKLSASNTRGNSPRFGAHNLADGNPATYWATDDSITTPQLLVEFNSPQKIAVVRLREAIALGQRIGVVALDAEQDGQWKEIATATSIGSCRLIRLEKLVEAARLRLRITDAAASIALSEFNLFAPAV